MNPGSSIYNVLLQLLSVEYSSFIRWNLLIIEALEEPTPVFLPGESQGRQGLVGCRLRGCTESDTTEGT